MTTIIDPELRYCVGFDACDDCDRTYHADELTTFSDDDYDECWPLCDACIADECAKDETLVFVTDTNLGYWIARTRCLRCAKAVQHEWAESGYCPDCELDIEDENADDWD